MKKLILLILILVVVSAISYYFQGMNELPNDDVAQEELEDLGGIIFNNTKFKEFEFLHISLSYPDWQQVEIDPFLIWPTEIAEKQEVLLYLTNSDKVKFLVTKRQVEEELSGKPYPLIFREIFAKDKEVLEKEGGVTEWDLIREKFFISGFLTESRVTSFGLTQTSVQQSVLISENNALEIYTVGISASQNIFEDYRPIAEYIFKSIRYY